MLYAKNNSFSAFLPVRLLRLSAYTCPAELKSCSLSDMQKDSCARCPKLPPWSLPLDSIPTDILCICAWEHSTLSVFIINYPLTNIIEVVTHSILDTSIVRDLSCSLVFILVFTMFFLFCDVWNMNCRYKNDIVIFAVNYWISGEHENKYNLLLYIIWRQ